jgi:DNA-binding winged helix-turn-helix (wHTH) protein
MMQVRFGDFVLDSDARELLAGGRPVKLSPKAFELLLALVEARPKALSKSALQDRLWPDTFVVEANLSNLVGELRAALGDDPRAARFVRTVHGFGYAFRDTTGRQPPRGQGAGAAFRLVWKGGREELAEGEHVLGRDPDLALCLGSPSVSRRHAQLRIIGGAAVIEDLGSKNGTFLNGEKVTSPMALSDGDLSDPRVTRLDADGGVARGMTPARTDGEVLEGVSQESSSSSSSPSRPMSSLVTKASSPPLKVCS